MAARSKRADSSQPLPAAILAQLACPVCLSDLALDERGLTCRQCGRTYPVVDGIPVLIAELESDENNPG